MRIDKRNYSMSPIGAREIVLGRLKIGHIKCPKCRQFFGIYQDEFYEDGTSRRSIKHSCGFNQCLILEGLQEEDEELY
jgi:phage FluMu protein Com